MTDVFLVRHAKVVSAGVCYGQSDVPTELTAAEAADAVFAQIARSALNVGCLWTSPWERTRPVADALGARLGVAVRVDARLSEMAMGRWEGRRFADIEAHEPTAYARWMEHWRTEGTPGGEALPAFIARVRGVWRELVESCAVSPRPSVVLTHAGVIRVVRSLVRNARYDDVASEPVEHLSLERLRNPS